MPGFLSPRKGVPLLLIPEYSGIYKGQRVPDWSKTAHRKPLVKCFLTGNYPSIKNKLSKQNLCWTPTMWQGVGYVKVIPSNTVVWKEDSAMRIWKQLLVIKSRLCKVWWKPRKDKYARKNRGGGERSISFCTQYNQ